MHFVIKQNRTSTALRIVYLERFDSYTSFVLLLHHFNELANNLVSHIINVSTALRCKNKIPFTGDAINPNQTQSGWRAARLVLS